MKRNDSAFTLTELLVVIAIIGVLIALLLPAIQASREVARARACTHQLMQLGVAAKNFEQAHGALPPGTVDKSGPIRNVPIGNHMGWIARLLPYLEQIPLYDRIDFSHGVYDPENRSVWLADSPTILLCPSDGNAMMYRQGTHQKHSSYVACHGSLETPIDIDNNGIFFLNSNLRSRDIPDGTSHTIFFGETILWRMDERISSYDDYWSRQTAMTIILPEEEDEDEKGEEETGAAEEDSEEGWIESFGNHHYHYGSLGWMSGSPGTLRNTFYPPNTYVGPFSNWPMPNDVIEKLREEQVGMFFDPDDETEEKEELFQPVLPPEIWKHPLPGQFLVGGFGSCHAGGTNFLFGDGSAKRVTSTVDRKVFQGMGNRQDSKPVDDP